MSDQPSPPPKPKPGSLRDRIAAFEKSASANAPPPAPAPAPRPKPAGFSSWKPKVPSPPSSPSASATDASSTSTVKAGGMSASDAKESITKAGSLKDRMAALQGKGAFGAPPALAPKPALEKPKWKPPPVVHAPVDDSDDHPGTSESSTAAIAAAVERTTSPPVSVKSHDSIDNIKSVVEGEGTSAPSAAAPEGDNEGEQAPVDPEEEERQRRAAIAARMARLGGARVGMAPPVFGKKPVRKPTQEEVPKPEEAKPAEEATTRDVSSPEVPSSEQVMASPPAADIVASPPTEEPSHDQAEAEVKKSPEILPQRKNSEAESVLSSTTTEPPPSRVPASMPVPRVPRRAGPPRKKPVKALSHPPPELPEEKAEDAGATPVEAPKTEDASPEAPQVPEPPAVLEEAVRIIEHKDPELLKEPGPESSPQETSKSDLEETKDTEPSLLAYHLDPSSISSPSLNEEVVLSPPPSTAETTDVYDVDAEEEGFPDEIAASPPVSVLYTASHALHADVKTPKPEVEHVTVADDVHQDETDVEEEEARKKRIADRMAKMGGVNPFAPRAPGMVSPPAQEVHSPPLASPPHVSSPPSIPAPAPEIVSPKASSILDPSPESHGQVQDVQKEEGPVESKVEEEESSDEEDEHEGDDVVENTARYERNENDADDADLSHTDSETRRLSTMSFRNPPVPPVSLTTRPPVQVQQYEQEEDEDEESDYGDEDENEVEVAAPAPATTSTSPPRRPMSVSSPPTRKSTMETPVPVPVPSPPTRPAQPPRRIIPQAPEEQEEEEEEEEEEEVTDEEADERLATSQLFVPPPSGRGPIAIASRARQLQDEEEDGDGSESDSPALPVPHRMSVEVLPPAMSGIGKSTLQDHDEDDEGEDDAESDHDGQALPIPPRRTVASVPRVIPPPPLPGRPQEPLQHPPHIRRALPNAPSEPQASLETPSAPLTPALSVESEEILDEEEGDPIDPSFHSPSRQTSFVNLRSTARVQAEMAAVQAPPVSTPAKPPLVPYSPSIQSSPPTKSPPPPPPPATTTNEEEEDAEQLRRKTIAERMAKLGGIRFGAAPIPTPVSRPPPRQDEDQQQDDHIEEPVTRESEPHQPAEPLSEEEEERARKERIAAKLANMGGMRIGMMPMGMGGLPPQRSHILRENVERPPPPSVPAPPTRAIPPSRPPPPPTAPVEPPQPQSHDTDSEYGTSEDGVKVEAEESEVEGGYEHVEEEAPPPLPSREGRRYSQHRQSTGPLPIPSSPPRPPVPSTMPIRRSSTKSSGFGDVGTQKKSSFMPQSEYVMVEEPENQEMPPPPPPARPTTRTVPPSRSAPQVPVPTPMVPPTQKMTDSISSHWELPSIPNSSLDFDGATDLSLSWTDAAEPASPITQAPPPPRAAVSPSTSASAPAPAPARPSTMIERQLSADELMALWGRIGVQVCESATSLFEKSKKSLIGDGSYAGFIHDVLAAVPNAAPVPSPSGDYGYVIYQQSGPSVQKRVSEIMPGDIVEIHDAKLKGHKGIQTYHQNVGGSGEPVLGVVGEFEAKKSKIKVFQANQHVGQQTVESVSYRLEDLKSGIVKVFRVLDA